MNKNKLIDDYNFGIESEKELLDKLQNKFDLNLKLSASNYSLFDYESNSTYIELKTRRCTKNFYKSTIVGMNKINRATDLKRLNIDIKIYFVFRFIDYICYWEFNEEDMLKLNQSKITRNDRHKIETAKYLEIPINNLIDF
jgi:hypothetical protein